MLENDLKKYSCAYMSDAKWRKLFSVVHDESLEMSHCVWKFVGIDEPKPGHVPDFTQLGENFVGDCGASNGPFWFKEIEWLLIPKRYGWKPYKNAPTNYITQDVESVLKKIQAVGHFETELSEDGLRVYGYKP